MLRFRLAIFFITVLVFARLMPASFSFWDDQGTIFENPRMNPPTSGTLIYYWTNAGEHETMGLYIPVTYTLWSGLARLAHRHSPDPDGAMLNAAVFHTANVLLHAATTVLVFDLLLILIRCNPSNPRMHSPIAACAIGALVFAFHPVQVESVGWVSGTKDLLCGFFCISALLMYSRWSESQDSTLRARKLTSWRYLLATLLFILGMLSKPTAIVTPLMAVVIGVFLLNRPLRQTISSLLPWFLLTIPCVLWTQHAQPPSWVSPLPQWAKPAVAADAIAFYLFKLVWPMRLGIDYSRNPSSIVASGAIYFTWIAPATLAVWLWWQRRKQRVLVAAAVLFLIPLLPLLGFVPFEFQCLSTTADHYLYLPLFGVGLATAWILQRHHSRIAIGIAITWVVLLAARSIMQESSWRGTRSLLNHALTVNPHSVIAFDGLGFLAGRDARQLAAEGHMAAARPLFDQSIRLYKTSVAYDPMSVPSRVNLALDYQQIGRVDLARAQIYAVIALQPKLQPGLRADPVTIAKFLINFQDIPGAVTWLEGALRRDPGNRAVWMLLQNALQHLPTPATNHSSERYPIPDMKNRSVVAGDAADVSHHSSTSSGVLSGCAAIDPAGSAFRHPRPGAGVALRYLTGS
jgi:hypothetical protein